MIWSEEWSRSFGWSWSLIWSFFEKNEWSFWWSWSDLSIDLDHLDGLDLWSDLIFIEKNHIKHQDHSQIQLQSNLVTLSLFFCNSLKYTYNTISCRAVMGLMREFRFLPMNKPPCFTWYYSLLHLMWCLA